ncbi:MAG: ABC transporter ATP-binding protein [Bacteroidetes bacterium]|nr:MAG: ABC transporter ATP-binding protein [Bacteroidota bacterium]PTM12305.1 MAG: ABC transporter ATP-binding protein [Bacteroidota bacterium]
MKIELQGVGKRYRREWILRNLQLDLLPAGRYAITGPNGSGKSTLLRMLSGHLTPTKGKLRFSLQERELPISEVYQQLAFAAPYLELIEEFSLHEALHFHQGFRPFLADLDVSAVIALLGMEKVQQLPISQFSSGMKQRLKLALACCTEARFILLDEPTTNLDVQGVAWYHQLLNQFAQDRLLVIASNVPDDYRVCTEEVAILDYK